MQWLYTQLLGTLYTLYHLELTELIRLGDLSAVLTSLLHQFIDYPAAPRHSTALNRTAFWTLDFPLRFLGFTPCLTCLPSCSPSVLEPQGSQLSHIHIIKLTRTYAASPSTHPSLTCKCDCSRSSFLLSPAPLFCPSHIATPPKSCTVCHYYILSLC